MFLLYVSIFCAGLFVGCHKTLFQFFCNLLRVECVEIDHKKLKLMSEKEVLYACSRFIGAGHSSFTPLFPSMTRRCHAKGGAKDKGIHSDRANEERLIQSVQYNYLHHEKVHGSIIRLQHEIVCHVRV